ncbi:ATPase [Thalassotalea insulae]|uniref:ATPase n=1 Tax=Thalassotalea insulae TaxID=2056778 RepID=A0ABQ6GMY0_9GAMM|nr:BadF/BadG/BcrA/BcrD ATPase family protein [Thalassotalea insulae]GLX77355.1 ATPase [Thalassotalea insulae]
MNTTHSDILYVGIDGGGTNCRVRIVGPSGELLGQGLGGTANPSHGLSTVIQSMTNAINMALCQAGLSEQHLKRLVVGAGLAGLHLPRYRTMMEQWQHPFHAIYYTDDLHAATLGAHDGKDGAVVIVGTGFSALSMVNGQKTAIGGYGFLQADHCSGSWLGYQAVQAALLAHDHLAPQTLLSELLFEQLEARGYLLADKLADAKAREYGTLAPLVFRAAEQGDTVARHIIADSSEFLTRIIKQLAQTNPPRISLIGGVAQQLVHYLDSDIVTQLSAPIHSAEYGAICFAKQQHQLISTSLS